MDNKETNAGEGLKSVEILAKLLRCKDPKALDALAQTALGKKKPVNPIAEMGELHLAKPPTTSKTDLFVDCPNLGCTVAIAVVSAGSGGGNQIERRKVDFYREDQGFSERLIHLLKLFTGTIPPSRASREEYCEDAGLEKGYAYIRDLNPANKAALLRELRDVRKVMLDKALLGRGNLVRCDDRKCRPDRVELIAFYDKRKSPGEAWTYCNPDEVLGAILTSYVKPADRGGRQIQLGHGVTLKRYGGSLRKGDDSIRDLLQLQIQPRKVLNESTNWSEFNSLWISETADTVEEAPSKQSEAAARGLKAETTLIDRINQRDSVCEWIVEETCDTRGYGDFKARKPNNREKPDVVIYNGSNPHAKSPGISLKTYKPKVGFGHANRGTVDTYARDLKMPANVADTLRAFATVTDDQDRTLLNQAPAEEQLAVVGFFTQFQRQIVAHVLSGKSDAVLKADWMMFHEAEEGNWEENVGNKKCWHLYPMAKVIDCCCSLKPKISKKGSLDVGLGLTLQRKGGDNGRSTANDLQFKISPKKIMKALEAS
jgi:hypothetical protein